MDVRHIMRRIVYKMSLTTLVLSLVLLQGCFVYKKDGKDLSLDSVIKQKTNLSSTLTSVSVVNNQLIVNGSGFSNVTSVKIQGNGVSANLDVTSVSDTQVVAQTTSALSLLANNTFNLIIGTVEADVTYPVTFTLQNGAVTAPMLNNMGASAGQVLKFNGTNWIPSAIVDAQTYIGTWDATTTIPDVTLSKSGDYYIVSVAGTVSGTAYAIGDWIISDGYNWTQVPYSKTSVASFNGRKGIVTLKDTDYVSLKNTTTNKVTGSSINDLADVDLTTVAPANGNILTYNGSKWIAAVAPSSGITLSSLSATSPLVYNSSTGNFSLPTANVLALPLTGLASATGSITATDTILGAFGKLMNTQGDYVSKSSGATITTGTIAMSGTSLLTYPTATGTTLNEVANVTYVSNAIAANGVWAKNGTSIGYTAGNVGIGTTAPAQKLSVAGMVESTSGGFKFPDGTVQTTAGGGGSSQWTTSGNDIYYTTGKIGVGTSNPQVPLHVAHTGGGETLRLEDTASPYAAYYVNGTRKGWFGFGYGITDYEFSNESSGSILFRTNSNTVRMAITNPGNVGIGVVAPRSLLDVAGTILGKPSVVNSTATVDFNTGNIQHTTSSCGAFALWNLKDGGTFLFIVKGTTAATCSFTAFSDGGVTALTVHMPPGHGATTAGKHTLYNAAVSGGDVYLSWVPGY